MNVSWIAKNLWLIPALPLFAAAVLSITKRPHRKFAATMTIGTMAFSFLLSVCAFAHNHAADLFAQRFRDAIPMVLSCPWFHHEKVLS